MTSAYSGTLFLKDDNSAELSFYKNGTKTILKATCGSGKEAGPWIDLLKYLTNHFSASGKCIPVSWEMRDNAKSLMLQVEMERYGKAELGVEVAKENIYRATCSGHECFPYRCYLSN